MNDATLTLVANPSSASRKYALFAGEKVLAEVCFEPQDGRVACTVTANGTSSRPQVDLSEVTEASGHLMALLRVQSLLPAETKIDRIGVRIVAPTSFFLKDHLISDDVMAHLEAVRSLAPQYIGTTLQELKRLRADFPSSMIVGVSDSAFYAGKPDYAWNYGLPLQDADRLDIKRFGYHGLSVAAIVRLLKAVEKMPANLIICHLGSGASVAAVRHGKGVDTTMGYSPQEGLVMATRVGSIDATAVRVLKDALSFDDTHLDEYLTSKSGLLGLSGSSSDVRELLEAETGGDHAAGLALATYTYAIQKAIGQMTAVLGGADMLVFTGAVGERSAAIRERIVKRFHYLDFLVDTHVNDQCTSPDEPTCISTLAHSRPIYVVPTDEAAEIVRRTLAIQ